MFSTLFFEALFYWQMQWINFTVNKIEKIIIRAICKPFKDNWI